MIHCTGETVKLRRRMTFYGIYCLFLVVRDALLCRVIMFRSYRQKNFRIMVVCRDEPLRFRFIYQSDLFGGRTLLRATFTIFYTVIVFVKCFDFFPSFFPPPPRVQGRIIKSISRHLGHNGFMMARLFEEIDYIFSSLKALSSSDFCYHYYYYRSTT